MTTSERYIGELGMRCLSTLNRVQDYRQSLIRRDRPMKASQCMLHPLLGCGERVLGGRNISPASWCEYILMYARELVGKAPCLRMNSRVYLEVCVIFSYLCTRKRNGRPSGDAGSLTLRDL